MTSEPDAPRAWRITTDAAYERMAKKFLRQHPDLHDAYREMLGRLIANPWDERLHTHPLHGDLRGFYGVSLTHTYRAVVAVVIAEREVILVGIGSHDEMYR